MGVTLTGEHSRTLYPRERESKKPFRICSYKAEAAVTLPNGVPVKTFCAKGDFLPEDAGATYALTGEWEERKGFPGQYTLAVTDVKFLPPTEEKGIKAYLKTLPGIGPVTADRLYTAFGDSVLDVAEQAPEKLADVKGIARKQVAKIVEALKKKRVDRELFKYLARFDVPASKIVEIYDELGDGALQAIQKNPYILVRVSGVSFYTADGIARKIGGHENEEERLRAGIWQVLIENENGGRLFNRPPKLAESHLAVLSDKDRALLLEKDLFVSSGNTNMDADLLYLQLLRLLGTSPGKETVFRLLARMHRERQLHIYKTHGPHGSRVHVFTRHMARAEFETAEEIRRRIAFRPVMPPDYEKTVHDVERRLGMILSQEQKEAVLTALTSGVSIITGGPGTGKTAVQKAILESYKALFPQKEITLLAPTGMAAKRMSEAAKEEARTLHSALHLIPDGLTEPVVLDSDFVILDEASMVDSQLMHIFLTHIGHGTRLAIIGDVDQLPSVSAGCVLRELIASGEIPTVRLTTIFRQAEGSTIAANAAKIKMGENLLEQASDFHILTAAGSEEIRNTALSLYKEKIEESGVENVSVLTAFRRRTETGVDALNQRLREIANPRSGSDKEGEFLKIGEKTFYLGDRIMFTKNSAELVNGDVGYITALGSEKDPGIVAKFSGKEILLEGDDLKSVVLAYATTVHKSQGSEYQTVIMVVDKAHEVMLKRNLVYTGITRAKECLVVVTSGLDALEKAIVTRDAVQRKSLLAHILQTKEKRPRADKEEDGTQLEIACSE